MWNARVLSTLLAGVIQTHAATQPGPAPTLLEFKGSDGPVYGLAWSPDGQRLASAGYKQVHVWRMDSATPLRTFRLHTDLVRSVAWSPDGALIASVGDDRVAYIWNADTLALLSTIETGHDYAIKWSADGRRVATAGATATLQIWNIRSGALLHRARLQTTISSLAWSPDGTSIVAGGINGLATQWNAETGTMVAKVYVSWPDRNDVNGVTWSPTGRVVAIAHGARGIGGVTYWNPGEGTIARALTSAGGWLRGISWSADGQWLAVGGEDGSVRIVNVETSDVAATLATDSKPIWSVAWSPDGRRLAAGNTGTAGPPRVGGTITVWEEPVRAAPAARTNARAREIEAMLIERRVVTSAAARPDPAATVFKDGRAYGNVVRLEPPFGNLETSFVESDLRALRITRGSSFEMVCRDKTLTPILGQHWSDVPRGEWVAYLSIEGNLIVGRNSASAFDASGCQPGDTVMLR